VVALESLNILWQVYMMFCPNNFVVLTDDHELVTEKDFNSQKRLDDSFSQSENKKGEFFENLPETF